MPLDSMGKVMMGEKSVRRGHERHRLGQGTSSSASFRLPTSAAPIAPEGQKGGFQALQGLERRGYHKPKSRERGIEVRAYGSCPWPRYLTFSENIRNYRQGIPTVRASKI